MNRFELIVPCHFGMEAVLKREIYDLGYDVTEVTDGRVTFAGDEEAAARANVFLRTAERVLIKAASFKATTFDELFEGVKAVNWEDYIPEDGRFWVAKAAGIKSKLFSPSDIQSIVKKAMVERLKQTYNVNWFSEEGSPYPLRVSIMKDVVTIGLDTSGESLHKRGYRKLVSKAPLSENLAAAMIMLTPWNKDRILVDPFCGCGTIPIEAAMIACNIAPGAKRNFTAQAWSNIIDRRYWTDAVEEARDMDDMTVETSIQGYDIDGDIIKAARDNAAMAGVLDKIHFQKRPVRELSHPKKYGFIITNPPYGERIGEKEEMEELYGEFAAACRGLDGWSECVITAYDRLENIMGRKADKNRKIYNGMMKTYFYQFMGPKPPKKTRPGADGSA
ncbi:MAG: class I SAM-dependent RNA methyltransferase [Lachnospiraceae bacterium]|nr:class I SAM-dependent RNA methyltransferase [Lachnospiraceae bacterium]